MGQAPPAKMAACIDQSTHFEIHKDIIIPLNSSHPIVLLIACSARVLKCEVSAHGRGLLLTCTMVLGFQLNGQEVFAYIYPLPCSKNAPICLLLLMLCTLFSCE